MSNLSGTNVAALIVPFTTEDQYATHEDTYGKGGFRSVELLSDLDLISNDRRKSGMFVYVEETEKLYKLKNGNWVEHETGTGSVGSSTVKAKFYTESFENVDGLKTLVLSQEVDKANLFVNVGNTLIQQSTYTLGSDNKTITFNEEIEAGVTVDVSYMLTTIENQVSTITSETAELLANEKYVLDITANTNISLTGWIEGIENEIVLYITPHDDYAVTLPPNLLWHNSQPPSLLDHFMYRLVFRSIDAGTTIFASYEQYVNEG